LYCSNCGAGASGNFCAACGAALVAPGAPAGVVAPAVQAGQPVRALDADPVGWENDVRYDLIVAVPTVRDRLAAKAAQANTRMTGEKFLDLVDKVYEPIPGISLTTVVEIASPIYAKLGMKTGKERAQAVAGPIGRVLADVLCLLALNGYTVKGVHQGSDGCVLECALPSDWRAFAGKIVVTVERHGTGTLVKAATSIPGQLYDWGKSKQALDRIFNGL
jgi:hypothetical protein